MDWGEGAISRGAAALVAALFTALVLAILLLDAGSAGAVVVQLPDGHVLGVAPRAGVAPASIPGARLRTPRPHVTDNGNMVYQGGPVVHSSAPYLIFWDPSSTIPPSTEALMTRYFADVAHDSGLATNVYGVLRQYSDSTGIADYHQTFSSAQVIQDTNPYPALDSSNCVTNVDEPTCVTDAQLQSELTRVIADGGLPTDGLTSASELGAGAPIYFIVTPANVNVCFQGPINGPPVCAAQDFCAYHSSYVDGQNHVLYSSIPLLIAENPAANPKACQTDNNSAVQEPNADPGDVALKYLSHEDSETITDPLGGTGWYDSNSTQGNEVGDNCNFWNGGPADIGMGDDPHAFLPTLGGSANPVSPATTGTLFDQSINGDHFYTQSEWSNAVVDCGMQPAAGSISASFTTPAGSPTIDSPLTFDPSASVSSTGYSSVSWSFGDGATSFVSAATTVGPSPSMISHTYTAPGTYTVTLTLVDPRGNLSTASHEVTIVGPSAAFSFSPAPALIGQAAAFDGTASSDSISGATFTYGWSFGDGATGSGASPTHTYTVPGTYTIELTITDSSSLSSSVSEQIQVLGPPTAGLTISRRSPLADTAVAFDGGTSSDPNNGGSIASYSWSFGDGTNGNGVTPSHTYTKAGVYTVSLTVTDTFSLVSPTIKAQLEVVVTPLGAFTFSPAVAVPGRAVTFDGAGSFDPNAGGSIASYSWSFGDGASAVGATTSHAYRTPGLYTAKLTVTDDFGVSTTVTHLVTVTAPGPPAASQASLSGIRKRRPKLSFELIAGLNAAGLQKAVIGLPSGLAFAKKGVAKGVSAKGAGGQKLTFTARLNHGKLTVTLRGPAGAVKLTIAAPALTATGKLARRVSTGQVRSLAIAVTAFDSAGTATRLGLVPNV